jgi:glycosyltransferase involved in cell wall biosynthesis
MVAVSIALCTHQGERFLAEQLDSLLAQTLSDFEIVVGDDASTDGTRALVARYAARDPRVRLIAHDPGLGLQRNFEATIAACRGARIAPCDQDDVWEPEKLEALSRRLDETGAVLAYCDSLLVDAAGAPLGHRAFELLTTIEEARPLVFAFANCVSGHAMMFERRLLDVALPFPDCPIYDWWLAAAASSIGAIARLDRPLVRYRQHDANVTDMAGRRDKPRRRGRTGRSSREREVMDRLDAFSRLPGETGEAYRRLRDLWAGRQTSVVTPALAAFVAENYDALYAIKPASGVKRLGRVVNMTLGLRLKRLLGGRD